MTINEAIAAIGVLKPHPYPDATLVRWLSDCDGMLYSKAVRCHGEDTVLKSDLPYDPETDLEAELLAPAPWSDLYLKYLEAQIEYYGGEYERYNNAITVFNTLAERFASERIRTMAPIAGSTIRTGVA